jgi:trans-aconitate 2-methyltransferase
MRRDRRRDEDVAMVKWDPEQYERYADERGRPFFELVGRIGVEDPKRVVDLGCGPGNLTVTLAARWPSAEVEGIDSSPAMIERAQALAADSGTASTGGAASTGASAAATGDGTPAGRVRFGLGDVARWSDPTADVIVSNACLQWIPDHLRVVESWIGGLPAGGALAFQVPGNFDAPSHRLMRDVAARPRWAARLSGTLRATDSVHAPEVYARVLLAAGLRTDVWETSYLHVLSGPDPVLEWVRGTGLRPILDELGDDAGAFEREYGAELRDAYPPVDGVTVLTFRRIFAVGHRD